MAVVLFILTFILLWMLYYIIRLRGQSRRYQSALEEIADKGVTKLGYESLQARYDSLMSEKVLLDQEQRDLLGALDSLKHQNDVLLAMNEQLKDPIVRAKMLETPPVLIQVGDMDQASFDELKQKIRSNQGYHYSGRVEAEEDPWDGPLYKEDP